MNDENPRLSVQFHTLPVVDEQLPPHRQGESPPTRNHDDRRCWVVSKDADPRLRMAFEPWP